MKNLIPHFIQDQFRLANNAGHFQAYTMFIDLSGFTPLTQTLMRQGNEGAEELSLSLNNIFAPMVQMVYQKGGFIPYFAGDAFTAIFPEENTNTNPMLLLQTAQELRHFFEQAGLIQTRFGDFQINIKIGLSFGTVEWGIVGEQYKSFFFRGDAINNCAESEHRAQGQDIILDDVLLKKFGRNSPTVNVIEERFYLLTKEIPFKQKEPETVILPKLSRSVTEHFLSESVMLFDQVGEFRNAISVFLSFEGINNYDLLNQFSSIVLNEINRFSGYFKEIDFGDKGGVMLGFFGAPVTFENNVERALEFTLAVEQAIEPLQELSPLRIRFGITSGLAYTGIVGGEERCQYAAVGNRVNLAARLMVYAPWGSILVDESIQRIRHFRFKHIGDTQYKGIEGDIPTYELIGRNTEDKPVFTGNMIGRKKELKQLIEFAKPFFKEQFVGLAYIYGEAGIGKTRLSFELKRELRLLGKLEWFICQADQILKKPVNPFIYFLKNYFEQSPEDSLKDNIDRFERRFEWLLRDSRTIQHPEAPFILRELARTKSILGAQIGIHYPGSLWEDLDAKGRYQNTFAALENLFKAVALKTPLVIELEDGHWFDNDSQMFLRNFARQMSRYPILILVTSRYWDDGNKPKLLPADLLQRFQIPELEIDLNILNPKLLRSFAELWLRGEISEELFKLLDRSTNGNPFYAEQIMEYFKESDSLKMEEGRWQLKDANIKVTNSISSILMARIDRLSSLVKETVKAAAVIGREFEVPILSEVMKRNQAFSERNGNTTAVLKEQIQNAEEGQIWRAMNELRYIFKHSLLRETLYNMQLRTRLRELHKLIAVAIEKLYPESIEERFVDLAFHYGQAEVMDKTNEYLEKAADYTRLNFQNHLALDFYSRLLDNLQIDKNQRAIIRTLLKKGSVLQLIGRWDDCQSTLTEALDNARKFNNNLLLGRANNNLGHLLLLKGNYEDAKQYLDVAATYFDLVNDTFGTLNVYGNLGNLYFRQGRYQEAKSFFIKSIKLSQDLPYSNSTAQIIANLGLTFMNQGQYDEGIQCQLEGLMICQNKKDKQGMATLHTNVGIVYYEKGDYDSALKHYEKGLTLSEELGNKLLTSIAIGCIGSVYQKQGDFEKAMENYIQDLEICEQLGDKQGTAIAIGLIGELRSIEGEFDVAIQYLEKNLELCEELNYQKGIAKAVNTLADIYTFQEHYDQAITYYDRAIDISRKINNRLVLCSSLIEKGEVLITQGKYEATRAINMETLEISGELGNPEIVFEALIFSAKVDYHTGKPELAGERLETLLAKTRNDHEAATVYYELYQMFPEKKSFCKKSLELYQRLYQSIPKYLFKIRLEELGG